MAAPRTGQSPDLSRLAQVPFGATLASIAAGQRAVDWLGAAAILHASVFRQVVESVGQALPGSPDRACKGTRPCGTPREFAARQRDMAFALARLSFDVGMTWLLRLSEALRA